MAHGNPPLPFLREIRDIRKIREIEAGLRSAANIVPWLNNQGLGAQAVIFFGEEHSNGEDSAVANVVIGNLPRGNNPFVVFERGLFRKYGKPLQNQAEVEYSSEPDAMGNDLGQTARRNSIISQQTIDALQDGHDVVYIFCGDDHHGAVQQLVLGAFNNATWIHKPSAI